MPLESPFNLYFDKKYCINIDSRTDRWAQVQAECAREGFEVERYAACVDDHRVLAFNGSQFSVLCRAYQESKGSTLILEDDCVFKNTMHLHYAMNELPPDWEVLYLGGNILGMDTHPFRPPIRHSAHLFKLADCWQTHAMVYSRAGLEHITENFKWDNGYAYDEWLRQNILPRGKSFIIAPQIAYQRPGWSDLWNCPSDYSSLFDRGNALLK